MDHFKALRAVNVVFGVFSLVMGLSLALVFIGPTYFIGAVWHDFARLADEGNRASGLRDVGDPLRDFGSVFQALGLGFGLLTSSVFLFFAGMHFVLAAQRRPGVLQIVAALLHVLTFPVGTVYAFYAVWVGWLRGTGLEAPQLSVQQQSALR